MKKCIAAGLMLTVILLVGCGSEAPKNMTVTTQDYDGPYYYEQEYGNDLTLSF